MIAFDSVEIYISGHAPTAPASHAGHHTHHTITCVHKPQIFHPKAASMSTCSTETPVVQQTAKHTTGGDVICRTIFSIPFLTVRELKAEDVEGLL